jgi:hypothetical protein
MTLFNGVRRAGSPGGQVEDLDTAQWKAAPVIVIAIGIDFLVDDDIHGYRTGGKGLDAYNDREFGKNWRLRRRFCLCIGLSLTQDKGPLPGILAFSDTLGSMQETELQRVTAVPKAESSTCCLWPILSPLDRYLCPDTPQSAHRSP